MRAPGRRGPARGGPPARPRPSRRRSSPRLTADGDRAAYLLSNPHNPTGTVHTPDELAALAALADEHGVRRRLRRDPRAARPADEHLHALPHRPGHRARRHRHVGLEGVEPRRAQGRRSSSPAPGAVDDVAPAAPLRHLRREPPGRHRADRGLPRRARLGHRLVGELDANRRLLAELVAEQLPGARLVVPEATYLAWLDLAGLGPRRRPDGGGAAPRSRRALPRSDLRLRRRAGTRGSTTPPHPRSSARRSADRGLALTDEASGPPLVALVVGPRGAYAVGPGVDEAWPLGDVARRFVDTTARLGPRWVVWSAASTPAGCRRRRRRGVAHVGPRRGTPHRPRWLVGHTRPRRRRVPRARRGRTCRRHAHRA